MRTRGGENFWPACKLGCCTTRIFFQALIGIFRVFFLFPAKTKKLTQIVMASVIAFFQGLFCQQIVMGLNLETPAYRPKISTTAVWVAKPKGYGLVLTVFLSPSSQLFFLPALHLHQAIMPGKKAIKIIIIISCSCFIDHHYLQAKHVCDRDRQHDAAKRKCSITH